MQERMTFQARKHQVQVDFIITKIEKAEESGFIKDSNALIIKHSNKILNGKL
jgi:antitoxin ParD1/3/4